MKVQELLTDPSKWTQGAYGRTATGYPVDERCDGAVALCLSGALYRCYTGEGLAKAFDRVRWHLKVFAISAWNDDPARTFAEVKALVTELDL